MKLSITTRTILGLFTAWYVVSPFAFIIFWLGFVFSAASLENQNQGQVGAIPLLVIAVFIMILCTIFINVGLHAFYFVHIILNKSAGDMARVLFGLGFIFAPILAIPVYYFIYILPENPPQWALAPQ